jgi:hypothetical protein
VIISRTVWPVGAMVADSGGPFRRRNDGAPGYRPADVSRAAWIVVMLLARAAVADARIPTYVEPEPARPRGTGEALRFSQFPDRTTAGGLRYDLYCPHTTDANPLVVVAPDVGATLEHAEPIAQHFARTGLIVVVVEPAADRASYPARIGAVLDEVLAARPIEPREPGCEPSGAIGAWGAGRGGVAVAELARIRAAAGQELAAVVTVFAASAREAIPDMATPLLVIEGVRVPAQTGPMARSLVIPGAAPCDLSGPDDPCARRMRAILESSRLFFRGYVDWDAEARAAVHGWGEVLGEARPGPREEPIRHERYTLLSFPLLLGTTNEGGFLKGIRPELVFARLRTIDVSTGPGVGLGFYGELLRWNGETTAGAGVTFVHYLGSLAYAPSVGMATWTFEREVRNTISAGLFLGLRAWPDRLGSVDFPIGVRVDGRFAYDGSGERAILVSGCLDLSLVALFALGVLGGVVTN